MKRKRVLFVITEDWALISHRLHLVDAAIKSGFEVGVATRVTKYHNILKGRGIKIFEWKLQRRSLNPLREVIMIISLYFILRSFPNISNHIVQTKTIR